MDKLTATNLGRDKPELGVNGGETRMASWKPDSPWRWYRQKYRGAGWATNADSPGKAVDHIKIWMALIIS